MVATACRELVRIVVIGLRLLSPTRENPGPLL